MRYLVNFNDNYGETDDTGEFDHRDEVATAIKSAIEAGEYLATNIEVFERVAFSVTVSVAF